MQRPVYLDYAATTPVDPRVVERMADCLGLDGEFGNPASRSHRFGTRARDEVDAARRHVAALIGGESSEIVWTSGATESDNLAILGTVRACRDPDRHVVTCATEHPAVLDPCRALVREGIAVTVLEPGADGRLDPGVLEAALRPGTALVSLMHVNNETGVVHDLATLSRIARGAGAAVHVDSAQGPGKAPLDVRDIDVDLVSLSGHKVHGPKGVGALWIRAGARLRIEPLLHGGGHEGGLRAGTLATHQIVGMGEAFRIAVERRETDAAHARAIRVRLWGGLRALGGVALNGAPDGAAGILNVSFEGVGAEDLMLAATDVAVSSGSACASASQDASHVLRAMGCGGERTEGSIRFSFGRFTTEAEIDRALAALADALRGLRRRRAVEHSTSDDGDATP